MTSQRPSTKRTSDETCCIELLIACTELADLDLFTKTDPMCVLFVKQFGQWREFGRTEAIRETLNPKFVQSFVIDFLPTVQQPLLFSLYDIDSRSSDLKSHDFVGSVEVKLDELLGQHLEMTTTTRTLRVPGVAKSRGLIHVTSELIRPTRGKVQFHVAAHALPKIGIMKRKPDTMLEIGRQINSVTFHPVFRSEVMAKTKHPWWRPFEVTIQRLCNDDHDRPIQFSCWNVNYSGGFSKKTFELLGRCDISLRQLAALSITSHYRSMVLINPKKEKNESKKGELKQGREDKIFKGQLRFYQFITDMQYSLLDYIRGGCRLRLITAIDFTASNGVVTDPLSLHNTKDARNNQYLNALEAVGSVIARYDPEQKVAAFGFGAKPSANSPTDYCLQLSSNVWAKGIKGVSEAYRRILPSLTFAGPTYITPILDKVMGIADVEVTQEQQTYFVLLVITDGIVNDMDAVVRKLIAASSLPLSVIVLGVGPSDFSLMEQFNDASNAPLFDSDSKKKAERPNYHFAALKDGFASGSHTVVVQNALAALSSQVLQYMKQRKVSPGRPKGVRMDPGSSWVDAGTVLDGSDTGDPFANLNLNTLPPHGHTSDPLQLDRRKSVDAWRTNSVKALQQSGLQCPTCGSCVDSNPCHVGIVH